SNDDLATFTGYDDPGDDDPADGDFDAQFGNDVRGVSLEDAEINGTFHVGDFKLRLGIDFRSGGADLQDAFAMYRVNPDVSVRMGRYKPHVLRSNFTDPDKLFFPYRTALGAAFDFYEEGVGVYGEMEALSWSFDVFNSPGDIPFLDPDNDADDSGFAGNGNRAGNQYVLRALWNVGRLPGLYETTPEDAFGAGSEPALTIGATVVENDEDGSDNSAIGLDVQGSVGRIGFGAEAMRLDDDARFATQGSSWNSLGAPLLLGDMGDSSTPWSIQANIMPSDRFGLGARIEDLDNANDETIFTLAANMYDAGHAGKLTAAISFISTDANSGDGATAIDFDDTTVFTLGYTFGASR
ncbi:MAG: hypothetical protein ACI9K5_003498, partial [Gammaproteobacteria bacterium]